MTTRQGELEAGPRAPEDGLDIRLAPPGTGSPAYRGPATRGPAPRGAS